jgi:hypothetical protein
MPLKTLGPIGPRAVGERVKKQQRRLGRSSLAVASSTVQISTARGGNYQIPDWKVRIKGSYEKYTPATMEDGYEFSRAL